MLLSEVREPVANAACSDLGQPDGLSRHSSSDSSCCVCVPFLNASKWESAALWVCAGALGSELVSSLRNDVQVFDFVHWWEGTGEVFLPWS